MAAEVTKLQMGRLGAYDESNPISTGAIDAGISQSLRNRAPMRAGAGDGALAERVSLPSLPRGQSLRFP